MLFEEMVTKEARRFLPSFTRPRLLLVRKKVCSEIRPFFDRSYDGAIAKIDGDASQRPCVLPPSIRRRPASSFDSNALIGKRSFGLRGRRSVEPANFLRGLSGQGQCAPSVARSSSRRNGLFARDVRRRFRIHPLVDRQTATSILEVDRHASSRVNVEPLGIIFRQPVRRKAVLRHSRTGSIQDVRWKAVPLLDHLIGRTVERQESPPLASLMARTVRCLAMRFVPACRNEWQQEHRGYDEEDAAGCHPSTFVPDGKSRNVVGTSLRAIDSMVPDLEPPRQEIQWDGKVQPAPILALAYSLVFFP